MVEQDESGDYGYDLADEARSAVTGPAERARRAPLTGIPLRDLDGDADGDFGYDLAHGA